MLCVGEILADLIGKSEEGGLVYSRKVGGAPRGKAAGRAQI